MRVRKWSGIAALVILFMLCAESGGASALSVGATGSNQDKYDYTRAGSAVNSYFMEDFSGDLMRFEAGRGEDGGHLVEWYDEDFGMVRSLTVPRELDGFGGFYKGTDFYFIVETDSNDEEDTKKEVFRIIKYDQNFKRMNFVSVTGGECYTKTPVRSSSLSMEQVGSELYIYTARQRFVSDDGLNHQSNLLIILDIGNMELSSKNDMSLFPAYHVSHSFNQLIREYNGEAVRVDHGDAYPRAVTLAVSDTGRPSEIFQIAGPIGENTTGVSIGGLEISDSFALISGNSVVQDKDFLTRQTRNAFFLSVELSTLGNAAGRAKTVWLTDYQEGSGMSAATPLMVKLSDSRFLVLWGTKHSDNGFMRISSELQIAEISGKGEVTSGPHIYEGNLAESAPIVHNGRVMWLTTSDYSTPQFYLLDYNNLGKEGSLETRKPLPEPVLQEPARELEPGETKLLVNGEQLVFDVPPQLENGRMLVPVRGLFEHLGADVYMGAPDQVYVRKDDVRVEVRINQRAAFIAKDGRNNFYELDAPAKLVNGRTLVPLRFIAEALDADVNWNAASNTVTVTTTESWN